jgi:hypothetical protein
MKRLGRTGVCNTLLDDKRDICITNESQLIVQLEEMCYQFLVKVAGEAKGLKLKYLAPTNGEGAADLEIDEENEIQYY